VNNLTNQTDSAWAAEEMLRQILRNQERLMSTLWAIASQNGGHGLAEVAKNIFEGMHKENKEMLVRINRELP